MDPTDKEWEFPAFTKTIHRASYPAISPKNPANAATGKVVLVTGGNAGVGKAIAKAFIEAGAKAVAILGRREKNLAEAKAELEKEGSSKVLSFVADILDQAALDRAFATTAAEVGKVDVVVSNAGYLSESDFAESADPSEWWKGFETNVKGTLLTFQAWSKQKGSNSPTFISINTAAAHAGVFPKFSSYGSSKLAAAQLVAYLQSENPDIRAVSIHPGALQTDMYDKAALPITPDDMSLPSSYAVWLASSAPDWVKGKFLWAHWDVNELQEMSGEIMAKNELTIGLHGWPKQQAERVVVW